MLPGTATTSTVAPDSTPAHTTTNIETTDTIVRNLPWPSLGFQSSEIGSNVFDVIEKFFANTEAPVCGSTILVLLKRFPNESDNSRLVSLIRSHHAILHVVTSSTPSGGSQPKTMYSAASKTNGIGAIESDEHFNIFSAWYPTYLYPYPVYATTIRVSGNGTKNLPGFYPSNSELHYVSITYQDHVPDDSFQNLNLRWIRSGDSRNFPFDSSDVSDHWYGGTYANDLIRFDKAYYWMAMDYNYTGQDVHNIQIRIYSGTPLNNWLPYSD
ncbi:hypothetical protein B9Z55_027336 [Caenorhabditis nigoni]|uniref:DUF7154 domain-containing protein n=2 Tax=Caenorhabditis nigoni TaxID=1611254 RepID=A0A2G5SFY9_9PELO|nr:hypothetical protein B9Z55_027336 [Caenorhabditis nigoni]